MRILVEESVGFQSHPYIDRTDEPIGPILCNRIVSYKLVPERRRRRRSEKKPSYQIPSLEAIKESPSNNLKVVSTFSGCGGTCLGLRWAGFEILWASEFVDAARETYQANFPETPLDSRDIRQVKAEEILGEIGLDVGDLDVLEGSPPCASFSMSGKRDRFWGEIKKYSDTQQRTDDLFFEFARLVDGLKPRVFTAENVPGLAQGKAVGYFRRIIEAFREIGYVVEARILDAQWLGVPQRRQRLFFVGVREDLGVRPVFPEPLPYRYSIRDAIPWIDEDRTIDSQETDISKYAIGEEWDRVSEGRQSRKYMNLIKPRRSGPCATVTQTGGVLGAASVVHPTEKRKFTIEELLRLCGFPDDFVLTGSYRQQWERLGRAVPPPVSRAVGETIAKIL